MTKVVLRVLSVWIILIYSGISEEIFNTGQMISKVANDDGDTQRGIARSYTKNGNIIKDNITSLAWQMDSSDIAMNWSDALNYCEALTIDGVNDWRLPTLNELLTLIDFSRAPRISIDDEIFVDTNRSEHWTRTEVVHDSDNYAFYVNLRDASSISQIFSRGHRKTNTYVVKCVKGIDRRTQPQFTRDNVNEIVTDVTTGLMWEDTNHTLETMSMTQGLQYCDNLELGGYTDWYLPNITELFAITDRNKYDPGINDIFQHYKTFGRVDRPLHDSTLGGNYWSSTYYSSGNGYHYYRTLDMQSGANARCRWYLKFQVRCTRQAEAINPENDFDHDGIPNNIDPDDDNDGILDVEDAFPLDATESVDTDGDGIGNNADTDDDNDGVLDIEDAFPLDATESVDTDGDGIGNNKDTDDDNDGILDTIEVTNGLNPLNASDAEADFDNDGFSNAMEISVGSDVHSATSKPIWVPVMMNDIIIFILYFA